MSDTGQKPPPRGDFEKAEKYINQLVDIINQNKLHVFRTDLKKFDPTSLQDHYTISLTDYQIEISHSKQPGSDDNTPAGGKNSYVMIFNNLKNLAQGNGEKVILGYVYLADAQYSKFKIVADRQIEERRRAEEEKRFKEALTPIDNLLDHVSIKPASSPENSTPKLQEQQSSSSFLTEQQFHQI